MACKEKKHAEIAHIEVAKLNTIHPLVSRAMVDGLISDDEFRLIISEIEKYNKLREEIRTKANKRLKFIKIDEIDEATKKRFTDLGRESARRSLISKLDLVAK